MPAPRQQCEDGTRRIQSVTSAEVFARRRGATSLRQWVTDVFDLETRAFVELFFKRKDHQHAIDVAVQRANTVSAPGPHLRADVVNDFEPFAMKFPREPHV